MYLTKNGVSNIAIQYECKNFSQVKNLINELTNTKSKNDDWREICSSVKTGSSDTVDYICFTNGEEKDCIVEVGYDSNVKQFLVWIEII